MGSIGTLVPAYGRDYKSAKDVKADWEANKDFQVNITGQYVNKEQVPKGETVTIRYKRLTECVLVKC